MLRIPRTIRRSTAALLAIATTLTIVVSASTPAHAINWGQIIPRIIPGIIETVQISSMSAKQEMEMGKEINTQLTSKQMRPLNDAALNRYVNQIGQRLASRSKRQDITYTFQVIDDNNINAAATMGGYLYVNKGTIVAADNEAQLASVLAHEIAHIEGKHTLEQAKNSSLARTGAAALKLNKSTLIGLASQFALDLPRSRRFELNADMDGLRMLRESGYDQQGMVEFMKKLGGGAAMPKWLSSHPQTQERVQALQKLIQKFPNQGSDGTDAIAYARQVGKAAPKVSTPVTTPAPKSTPAPAPVVVPAPGSGGKEVIVPTE
jgi:beta-barrel assembly-enhancing protease